GVPSVGPVLGDLLGDTGLSAAVGGLLTTISVFAFGAFAFLTPALTRRFGMHRVLGILMIVLAAGIGLRLQPSLLALFAGTVLVALLWLRRMVRRPASFSNPGGAAGSDAADSPSASGEPPFRSILTDPIAWAVTGFMGLQSMSYGAALTWVPAIFQDSGMAAY